MPSLTRSLLLVTASSASAFVYGRISFTNLVALVGLEVAFIFIYGLFNLYAARRVFAQLQKSNLGIALPNNRSTAEC